MFFKDYQLQSLRVLWDSGEGLSSRDAWERVGKAVCERTGALPTMLAPTDGRRVHKSDIYRGRIN
jgi:hypothetical protein